MTRPLRALTLFVLCVLVSSCSHPLTMHALDGERLDGRWRHAREGKGVVQVHATGGEVLVGTLQPVPRRAFFENYQKTFGSGTIDADIPDLSEFGNPFAGMFGNSTVLVDTAYGENFNAALGKNVHVVKGPLFYWTAYLQGDKRATMQCFLIGSSYTGHGLGRCKGAEGKEYTVEF